MLVPEFMFHLSYCPLSFQVFVELCGYRIREVVHIKINILQYSKQHYQHKWGSGKEEAEEEGKRWLLSLAPVCKLCLHTSKLSSLRPGGGSVSARLAPPALGAVLANCLATAAPKLAFKPELLYWQLLKTPQLKLPKVIQQGPKLYWRSKAVRTCVPVWNNWF